MEIVIILALIVGIVWAIIKMFANDRAWRRAELDKAWRNVLSDPNYSTRRVEEERKLSD
jgi:hypothetical protein